VVDVGDDGYIADIVSCRHAVTSLRCGVLPVYLERGG
jgi:hypothetical protein